MRYNQDVQDNNGFVPIISLLVTLIDECVLWVTNSNDIVCQEHEELRLIDEVPWVTDVLSKSINSDGSILDEVEDATSTHGNGEKHLRNNAGLHEEQLDEVWNNYRPKEEHDLTCKES